MQVRIDCLLTEITNPGTHTHTPIHTTAQTCTVCTNILTPAEPDKHLYTQTRLEVAKHLYLAMKIELLKSAKRDLNDIALL